MQDYGNLINTFQDYLIYDDRKQRVLHTRYLNKAQFYEMWRFHFSRLRPDLGEIQHQEMNLSQRINRGLFGYMRYMNGKEIAKCYRMQISDYPDERCTAILDNYLNFTNPTAGQPILIKMTSWDDACRNLIYIRKVLGKIQSFGLHYPIFTNHHTQEQKAQMEEQLYQNFKTLLTS